MPSPLLAGFTDRILGGDARSILTTFPANSIDCIVTSPPYWQQRDYGVSGQLGHEAMFTDYVDNLCGVFDEIKRVLKPTGTAWVNLGDTYTTKQRRNGMPTKCLLQLPSRFALEMTARGWTLRNEIIWHKPNCMPESAKDRFTTDFEKLYFFTKSPRYYFRQQLEAFRSKDGLKRRLPRSSGKKKQRYGETRSSVISPKAAATSHRRILKLGRNKRCVWMIPTRPFAGNHFATFPPALIETPIKAGCPKGGIVLDPFMGSGTTALVAWSLGRHFIGIDLNPAYVQMASERLAEAAQIAA